VTAAQDIDASVPDAAAPVELIARVVPDGHQFVAVVDGLDLQSSGRTPEAAENGLVQAMRGWLERQDTVGRLGLALGIDHLNEETEIVLRFVNEEPAGQE
jgi:hypothetical protein